MSLVLRPGMPRASLDFLSLINEHPAWRLSLRGEQCSVQKQDLLLNSFGTGCLGFQAEMGCNLGPIQAIS